VGEGGDEVSVARFIADQRTKYRVPHALGCRFLGVSQAWFYKWVARGRQDALAVEAGAEVDAVTAGPVGACGPGVDAAQAHAAQAGAVGGHATEVTETSGAVMVLRGNGSGRDREPAAAAAAVAGPVAGMVGRARRRWLEEQVRASFQASGGTYGSPRVWEDLAEAGWAVSVNTVAASMRRQRLVARPVRRRRGLTRPDKAAVPFPDLLRRDFTAAAPNTRWVGDITEIPTTCGRKLYLATVIDLYSRRLLGSVTGPSPNAQLCKDAITMAVTARGGRDEVAGVIFHSDRGSTYTDHTFSALCGKLGIKQSMGRVGSCFDNAAAESFFSTLEHELLSRQTFTTPEDAKPVVGQWCYEFYNRRRRHSKAGMLSPVAYEHATLTAPRTTHGPDTEAA
jgi:putative transposase